MGLILYLSGFILKLKGYFDFSHIGVMFAFRKVNYGLLLA